MTRQEIIDFFDRLAPEWDSNLVHDDIKINAIFDYAGITKGVSVLDAACGTGVLIPDYLGRDVKKVTAVDISPKMIEIARKKISDPRVEFIIDNVETADIPEVFDRCVLYNAFPHFPNPRSLVCSLAGRLVRGGRLTVAHGLSREKINAHHNGRAGRVSMGLISENDLSRLFGEFFIVDVALSSDAMYVVSGIRK